MHLPYSAGGFAIIPSYKIASSSKFSSVSTTDPSTVFSRFVEDHMAKSGNRLVQSVEHLTAEQEVVGSIPGAKPILGSQNN